MIGLSRLKRAIGDVPTGGMQTGDPKVRLKLCDAQRLEVEYGALIAERDEALAKNAELVAQVEALKDWRRLALQFDGHRMQAMSLLKQVATTKFSYDEVSAFLAAAPISGNEHLRDIQAEAGRAEFVAGCGAATEVRNMTAAEAYSRALQYAYRIKAGEE